MKVGPDGMDYHRYLATDNDKDYLPDEMDMARSSEVERRQLPSGFGRIKNFPYVRINATLQPNSTAS